MSRGKSSEIDENPSGTRFFEGLAWPVPVSFSSAISSLRLEQGDVIYSDPKAYDALEGAIPRGLKAIQVLLPPRSARGTNSEAEGDRRAANWRSEATIALVDLATGQSETRVLSQGKLAMAIIQGDEAWLEPETEEPALLRSARELQQRLPETLPLFDGLQAVDQGSRFVFVVDLASDASRVKAIGVEEALESGGPVERIDLTPEKAGLDEAEAYHPTSIIRCLALAGRSPSQVLPILRRELYAGAAAAPDEAGGEADASPADRFSIGRHGILEAIPPAPDATR